MKSILSHLTTFFFAGAVLICFVSKVEAKEDAPPQKNGSNRRVIPLNQIWAYDMPGTKDIGDLGRHQARSEGMKFLASISESSVLRAQRQNGEPARQGFAVVGNGLTAMRAAHAVMEGEAKQTTKFSPDDEITLVFFSEPATGAHVYVRRVEREGNNIEIQYQLEPYIQRHYSFGFALIPLGRLPFGQYTVGFLQLRAEERHIRLGFRPFNKKWSDRFLCKPFTFKVIEKGN
jgi:hypothetical protein